MSSALGAGLSCAVVAGIAGSLFTVPTRKEKELGIFAIKGTWEWCNIWFVFTIFNVLVNLVLAQILFGIDNVMTVYADEVSSHSRWAVIISSALWAVGTLSFGFGVDLSGVALGVGLAMTSQIIFGTALGIKSVAFLSTAKGGLLLAGIAIAIFGFAVMGRAGWIRDHPASYDNGTSSSEQTKVKAAAAKYGSGSVQQHAVNVDDDDHKIEEGGRSVAGALDKEGKEGKVQEDHGAAAKRLWLGVMVSLFAGLFSALLQYAFIYGKEIVDRIQQPPYAASSLSASAIIWTVSTAVNNLVQIGYLMGLITRLKAWGRYFEGGAVLFIQNASRCLLMSILLNVHIELYGLAQAYLGDLGPVVAWPLVMSLVVLMSQVWGLLLKEWQHAPIIAKQMNSGSIAIIISGIILLGVAASL